MTTPYNMTTILFFCLVFPSLTGTFQLIQGFNCENPTAFLSSKSSQSRRMSPMLMLTASNVKEESSKTEYNLDPKTVLPDTRAGMEKTVKSLQKYLCSIHVGRASPDILSRTTVRAYGVSTPISQLATISVVGMQQLTVEPYDPSLVKSIARATMEGDLGLSPTFDGNMIYVDVPPLNEEVRISMSKKCKHMGEEGKVSIRNMRRTSMESIKKMTKSSILSQDEGRRMEEQINSTTEEFANKVEDLIQRKIKEVMTV